MEKANILVVDDDKEIAELVGIHLREEGYEVYKAYSGKAVSADGADGSCEISASKIPKSGGRRAGKCRCH